MSNQYTKTLFSYFYPSHNLPAALKSALRVDALPQFLKMISIFAGDTSLKSDENEENFRLDYALLEGENGAEEVRFTIEFSRSSLALPKK